MSNPTENKHSTVDSIMDKASNLVHKVTGKAHEPSHEEVRDASHADQQFHQNQPQPKASTQQQMQQQQMQQQQREQREQQQHLQQREQQQHLQQREQQHLQQREQQHLQQQREQLEQQQREQQLLQHQLQQQQLKHQQQQQQHQQQQQDKQQQEKQQQEKQQQEKQLQEKQQQEQQEKLETTLQQSLRQPNAQEGAEFFLANADDSEIKAVGAIATQAVHQQLKDDPDLVRKLEKNPVLAEEVERVHEERDQHTHDATTHGHHKVDDPQQKINSHLVGNPADPNNLSGVGTNVKPTM
ncbi:hypothetical protein BGZ76_011462 [Entomortierella beljakovae]|nr:hypothetical protein BGZ76_011462 [Entomortierella beljakovae]